MTTKEETYEEQLAREVTQLQDALGCPPEMEGNQEKAMERIRDLIAAEGELGDLKDKIKKFSLSQTGLHKMAQEIIGDSDKDIVEGRYGKGVIRVNWRYCIEARAHPCLKQVCTWGGGDEGFLHVEPDQKESPT